MQNTKNIVETINEIPPIPKIKLELTRSNPNEVKIVVIVKRGIDDEFVISSQKW